MMAEDTAKQQLVAVCLPPSGTYTVISVKPVSERMLSQGSTVGRVKNEELNKVMNVLAPTAGSVSKVFAEVGDCLHGGDCLLKVQPCEHSTILKDMCAKCGADLRGVQDTSNASVSIVHHVPELKVSAKEAQSIGKEDRVKLLKARKLILLVDLDHTLVHTTELDVDPKLESVHHYQLWGREWYHTKVRPHLQQFLEKVHDLFELHVFTFGARMYAHTVTRILDPDTKYFEHRIVSRDELFNSTTKMGNIKSLFPCGDEMVCIIDDRLDVWDHAMNLIHVKPYTFFKQAGFIDDKWDGKSEQTKVETETGGDAGQSPPDTNKIRSDDMGGGENSSSDGSVDGKDKANSEEMNIKWTEEEVDDYLLHLEDILQRIHKTYYERYAQSIDTSNIPDLKTIIPHVRSQVLKGAIILFSGVIPKNSDKQAKSQHPAYITARSLGASIGESLDDTPCVTHLIGACIDTEKVKQAKKMKDVKVVSVEWLWCCAERWEWVEEAIFPLLDSTAENVNKEGVWRGSHKTYSDCDSATLLDNQTKEEMLDEVDAYLAEGSDDEAGGSDEGEESNEEEAAIDKCGDGNSSSSSQESLSGGSCPKGWKDVMESQNKNRGSPTSQLKRTLKNVTEGADDVDKHSALKKLRCSADLTHSNDSDSENSDQSYKESVGSVDEEMADALEKELQDR